MTLLEYMNLYDEEKRRKMLGQLLMNSYYARMGLTPNANFYIGPGGQRTALQSQQPVGTASSGYASGLGGRPSGNRAAQVNPAAGNVAPQAQMRLIGANPGAIGAYDPNSGLAPMGTLMANPGAVGTFDPNAVAPMGMTAVRSQRPPTGFGISIPGPRFYY